MDEPACTSLGISRCFKESYYYQCYVLGLYRDNGKENGNYYIIIGYILGLYYSVGTTPIMENQMDKKMENEMETGII